jgi:hypothetical protein
LLMLWIDPRQLWDIAGHLTAVCGLRHGRADVVKDRGDVHVASLWGQGHQFRKFAISRRPASWLFSGWNCVPTILSRPTIAVTSPP